MADLLHRTQHEDTTELAEAPVRVPESREVEQHRRRVTGTPRHADTKVRWLGWVALIVLAIAGLVVAAIAITADDGEVVEWNTITHGPGSNSLAPTVEVVEWETVTHGPGSNSLAPTVEVLEWETATSGPGSNSLGPTAAVIYWPTATQGPGSNSLGPTD